MASTTRRAFLIAGAALGGLAATGAVVGVGYLASIDTKGLKPEIGPDGQVRLNAWVEIRPDGQIVFAVPRAEIGQGVHTGVAMLMAEEMEVSLDAPNVSIEHPVENLPVYANQTIILGKRPEEASGPVDWGKGKVFSLFPLIVTGGSTSIVDAWIPLRTAGATAREMLITAAADRWGVPRTECRAEAGEVLHAPSGRREAYGALAKAAAEVEPPASPPLKSPADWKLIGTNQPRLDIPPKVLGKPVFGVDVTAENMVFATVRHCPVFGGQVRTIDSAEALALPGVIDVVNLENAVAVVGETYYHAKQGADALSVEWDEGEGASLSSESIAQTLRGALDAGEEHVFREEGDAPAELAGDGVVEALYETPYLAHACMEPMNCTAVLRGDVAELWAPTQTPLAMLLPGREAGAKDVITHTTFSGGGFGRRGDADYAFQAMKVAAALPGRTVKLVWSREEDIQHDAYRPASAARVRAKLAPDGSPVALDYKIAVQSVEQSFTRRNFGSEAGGSSDLLNIEGANHIHYALDHQRIAAVNVDLPVPVGYWRSVGHANNAFVVEGFIDELAAAAGADPLDYRRRLLRDHPRLSRLADVLKAKSNWTGPQAGAGRGRGVAIHESFRSYVGQVADVTVSDDGAVTVDKVVCVVDCGVNINPDTIRSQMEGSILFTLSAVYWGEVQIEGGRAVQSNFYDYDMVRMSQSPEIEVHIIENGEAPSLAEWAEGIAERRGGRKL
ncbi:MAG: molybdopterin cofactor-binding domain-containing protein, partial [Pseudomonadota bacterium]